MKISEYESKAVSTAIYSKDFAIIYPTLGLTGESGEVAEKIKKMIRDGVADPEAIHKEIGDCLWYLSALCRDISEHFGMDLSLEKAATDNLEKLADRCKRGVLSGNGDNR